MLSICIPIYNQVPVKFINDLQDQITQNNICAEIVILDDGSQIDISKDIDSIKQLKSVRFHKLASNSGRSAARNTLGSLAKGSHLLFIDGDSGVNNPSFLSMYLPYMTPLSVCCGGTIYAAKKPDKALILRWKYGHKRETTTARKRNEHPWDSFTTHHFLIDRSLFLSIKFDEHISEYGHEDTIFGFTLKQKNIKITHIDNPLLHLGLEPSPVFIKKTNQALLNLCDLYRKNKDNQEFTSSIKLISFYKSQQKARLLWFWKLILILFKNPILLQLQSKNPSLLMFDIYKMSYFSKCVSKGTNFTSNEMDKKSI